MSPASHGEQSTDDLRIRAMKELISPDQLIHSVPVSAKAAKTVIAARQGIHRILTGEDDRLLIVVGAPAPFTTRWRRTTTPRV